MKGQPIPYSADEMAWLEANRLLSIADYHRAFVAAFGRDDVAAGNLHSLRKRKGWSTGRTGRFASGQAAWNKGKPHPPTGRARETQFKSGQRSGTAARNYKPIGYERLSKEGYVERKLHDGLPFRSRWRGVHLIRWEADHGPVPKGHALKSLDGDKGNTDPSNWTPVPRALLPRLNGRYGRGYDQAAPEVKPAILAIAKLEHRARTARKAAR